MHLPWVLLQTVLVVKTRQQLACQPSSSGGHARVTRDRGLHPRHVRLRLGRPEPYRPEPAGRIWLQRLFAACILSHILHRVDVTIYANVAAAAGSQAIPSGEDTPARCAQFGSVMGVHTYSLNPEKPRLVIYDIGHIHHRRRVELAAPLRAELSLLLGPALPNHRLCLTRADGLPMSDASPAGPPHRRCGVWRPSCRVCGATRGASRTASR